jgi:phenylacetate-CoA ligase
LFRLLSYYYVLQGGKGIYEAYSDLKQIQHNSQEEIEKVAEKKLKNIIEYADRNVLYYKNLFKEKGVNVSELKGFNDLNKIPILNKRKIRDNYPDKITAQDTLKRAVHGITSGTTGEPLFFYKDKLAQPYSIASIMFANELMGVKLFDIHWNPRTVKKRPLKETLSLWLHGKYMYHIFDINKENLGEIIRQIDTIRPSYIESNPTYTNKIARLFKQEGVYPKHKPKAVISSSEMLLKHIRMFIEHEFQSEVFDRYGHNEFSPAVGMECREHDGFHLNPLLTLIEVVDEEGNQVDEGEEGRILITDLNNRVMPFIRYEVGDLGEMGGYDCPCGISLPVLKSIKGRKQEVIVFPRNEFLKFGNVRGILIRNFYSYVYMFQFAQHTKTSASIKIVPTEKYTKGIDDRIKEEVLELLHRFEQGFELEVYVVDDIPPEESGKTPFIKMLE